MKRSAGAEAPARLLLKKSEVCRLLSVSCGTFEKMLEEGRVPAPVWLGATANSRRWPFATVERYVTGLSRDADRQAVAAHA